MTAAVLSIGTELTRGEIVNTNASWLASQLTALGHEVTEASVVDDDPERIGAALRRLGEAHGVIVSTGGLGPTTDDLTALSVARCLGTSLVRHLPSLEAIRRRFEALGRPMSPTNEKQADLPESSSALPNAIGTAPGFSLRVGQATAFFLPGVPREMKRMFVDHVVPRVVQSAPNLSFQIRIKTFGAPEAAVGEKLAGIEERYPGITLGYRAHFPEIEVKILARSTSQPDARVLATRAREEVLSALGPIVYGEGEETFPLAVAKCLRARGWKLALGESCTGGLLSQLLTQEPASDFFLGSCVTYANSAKTALLGVKEDVLREYGAVSAEVASAMAEGIRQQTGADIAASITGIAGPTGGSPEKPVGLVFWAVAHPGGTLVKSRTFATFERTQIQLYASFAALASIRDVAQGKR